VRIGFGEERMMIKVTIDSVRASLLSQHRVVVLREEELERYLAIWIGPYEADAITIRLQGVEIARPLTHDLLKQSIDKLGATVSHILVNDLHDDTFYARVVMDRDGERIELDSRPSDAIALAVRTQAPIFVSESVMERAGVTPDEEIDLDEITPEEEEKLAPYRDFIEGLDLGDMGE
jgi:bifunctional DNase/RNase